MSRYWLNIKRLACVAVTLTALIIIFRGIDKEAFYAAMAGMDPRWFILTVGVYGVSLVFGSWRWHMALRTIGAALHPATTFRLTIIGHYLSVILFGGVGGDVAKTALYSRWYRLPYSQVLASSPLDRLLGLAGLVLFASVLLGLAATTGALQHLDGSNLQWSSRWAVGIGVLSAVMIVALVLWEPPGESAVARLLRTIKAGLRRLLREPFLIFKGVASGFFVQLFLSLVIALNLQAVSKEPLPWGDLFWVFPIISMLGSLPVTVAGLGVREGSAILLLGLYGVPGSNAVAASLLSLATNLVWAGVGGGLWWREGRLFASVPTPSEAKSISAIIPVLNEAEDLPETVRRIQQVPEIREIVVVDGGSDDGTPELAEQLGCRVLRSNCPSRGGQMRAGAAEAQSDIVLLIHADTWLPRHAGKAALMALRDPFVVAGGYWKVFRRSPLLLLGSRFKCAARFFLLRRFMGDQGLFVRRNCLEQIGGVPDVPLMEEFELCRLLRKTGRLALAEATIETSARRFLEAGIMRTYWKMFWVWARYQLGTSPEKLWRMYQKE